MYYTFNENIHTHACIYILPTTPPHPHHGEGWRKTDPKGTCSLPSAIYWWECAVSLRHLSFKPTWLTLVRIYLAMENISAWAWVTDSLEFIYHWLSYQLLVCDNPTCLLFEDQCLYSRGSNHSLILTGGGIPWDGGLSYIYLKSQNPHENGTRSWMKNHMTAKTSEQQIGLPFFQRVFGKQPGENSERVDERLHLRPISQLRNSAHLADLRRIRWYYSLLPPCSRAARTTIAPQDCRFLLSSSPLALPAMHRFWGMKN